MWIKKIPADEFIASLPKADGQPTSNAKICIVKFKGSKGYSAGYIAGTFKDDGLSDMPSETPLDEIEYFLDLKLDNKL